MPHVCACKFQGIRLNAADRSDSIGTPARTTARPPLREHVANAVFNKAVCLQSLGRSEAAIGVYNELLARIADAGLPAMLLRLHATGISKKRSRHGPLLQGAARWQL